jgi:hypothetical protein
MQIRCQQCHKPYGMSKETVYAAIEAMHTENLHHYDSQCPHCRRVNRISRDELIRSAPGWGKEKPEEQKE